MVKGGAGFRGSTHAPVENETVPVEKPDIIITLF
jgi:hypothetical protein